ncbi:oxidoreductase C-terminal domain-containing protein [Bradyrhizobium sp. RT5a]|uniref:oxidoreductase C-terminal domain-containing protein n=1 Tax=unclassified Bradyrhizobium TaxID=2631580 RepID=UPI0033998FED
MRLPASKRTASSGSASFYAELIALKHERSGVRIEPGAVAECIDVSEGRSNVVIAGGRSHLAHLAIVGVGATPNIELEQTAGLAVDEGIVPGRCSRLRFRTFWRWLTADRLYKKRIRLEASRNAQRQKAAVATNLLGETVLTRTFPGFGSDQYDQTLQILGLCPEREVPVIRDLGARRQILFYLAADGRLEAAFGFGSRAL